MPELPEVETVRRTIAPHVVGRRILRVDVRERRLRRPIARDFAARLAGRRIAAVERRGKYLLLDVGDGLRWIVHLGMSGRFCVGEPPAGMPHVHVVVALDGGRQLYFRDPRRFGLMLLSDDERALGPIGVEPLDAAFTGERLFAATRRRPRTTMKSLLMDQREVAGLGNIYVNEALYLAGVRPSRRAGRLTRAEAEQVAAGVQSVLARAIESRGSSLLDYRDADGNEGEFQRSLGVYEREGQACRRCGATIRRLVIVGRSSFYCPACQR
ncbi:MAG TPA: bifunctional DNA-formamidopyrimidine glycosylase/DNA-(apurinic or apyrimidinic site) lyase [Candidatus Binatia bacterium]|nr:bifunctional DNA-formamidopyrimidine glycosylase/DNA-(apurinic or apyrimidinic site) lyase [Candidatus Binatia bacterium]